MTSRFLSMDQLLAAAQQRRGGSIPSAGGGDEGLSASPRSDDVLALAQTLREELELALGPRLRAIQPQLDKLAKKIRLADLPTERAQLLCVLDELEDQLEALLR